ncbi:hypothetical protein HBI14_157910 [Parastagonospora nodorum]|nr:hypothetical protein HBI14_157910 [Parastagonospora nodorum]
MSSLGTSSPALLLSVASHPLVHWLTGSCPRSMNRMMSCRKPCVSPLSTSMFTSLKEQVLAYSQLLKLSPYETCRWPRGENGQFRYMVGRIGLEGYLCILRYVFFLLDSQHTDKGDRKASTLAIMLKLVFTQSLLYHLSIALVKTAFTLQYLRLFSLIRPITICCYILFGCIIGAAAWGIFGVIFLCKPIHTYWNLRVNGTCMDAETHFFSTSLIGIVLDWAIWILPIPVVGRLKLPRRQKWGLMCVFGLGGMVCVVSVLRLVLVWCYAHEGRVTKSGTFALIWSTLELNVAIICASLLVMKPLFARYVPAMVSDQPVSAREDARLWRAMTGLAQLDAAEDGKKDVEYEGCGRRDTVVESDIRQAGLLMIPRRAWDPKRGLRVKRRSSLF